MPFRPDHPKCLATKKSDGQPCQAYAMPNGRCKAHGGMTPTGTRAGRFVTGRYSKALPSYMLDAYETARDDPNLLSLRDDIAVLDTRIGEVIGRINSGESGATWRAIQSAWKEFSHSKSIGDVAGMAQATSRLGDAITAGLGEYSAWDDIRALLQERAKLADGERKRLVDLQQNVPAERVMVLVSALLGSVREHVHESNVLEAISGDFVRLVGGQNRHRLTSSSYSEGNGRENQEIVSRRPASSAKRPRMGEEAS